MKRKWQIYSNGILFFLAGVVALAWVQSYTGGYERTWDDPDGLSCGRYASSRGHFFRQSFSFEKRVVTEGDVLGDQPVQLPANFVVGSNQDGERTEIPCGPLRVPFAQPGAGLFFGLDGRVQGSSIPGTSTFVSFSSDEYAVAYWFLMAIVLLEPIVEGGKWLWRQIRGRQVLESDNKQRIQTAS
jgi:hypothetical protein